MAHRALCFPVNNVQSTETPGLNIMVFTVNYWDDDGTTVTQANISVYVNPGTQTGAQIQAAVIAAIIDMGAQAGYTIATGTNQLFLYLPNKA